LDHLEEVVRPIDLVHLAGLAVADDEGRPVHRPRHLGFLAHDLLGLVLGHEVRVLEVLGLVEHVFAEHALVQTGRGDRRDVVQVTRVHRLGELHHVARALDVGAHLAFLVGLQVVDRGEMEHRVDATLE
jgi:hypothetical protein